jgi:hypothetical protein
VGVSPEYVKDRGRRLVPLKVADIARARAECPVAASVNAESTGSRYMEYMQNIADKYNEVSMGLDGEGEVGAAATYDSFDSPREGQGKLQSGGNAKEDEYMAYDSFDEGEGGLDGDGGGADDDDVTYDSFNEDEGCSAVADMLPDGYGTFDLPGQSATQEEHGVSTASSRLSSTTRFEEEENPDEPVAGYGAFAQPSSLPTPVGAHVSSTLEIVEEDNPNSSATATVTVTATPLSSAYGEFGQYDAVANKYDEESPPHSDDDETELDKAYSATANPVSPTRPAQRKAVAALADPALPPCPLSPDALSGFSNFDPAAVERNREIMRATERLVQEVIPALAKELGDMRPFLICNLNFSVYFHSNGVNIRHMGLVRSLIPVSNVTSPIRTALLLQIVARTLKNIARDYQRRWMKSEQSTSEQGMHILLTEFLNLVVGSNDNTESFWTDKVVVGIIQRFGACSLDHDVDHLHRLRKRPQFLKV